jgi:hypothetical protein
MYVSFFSLARCSPDKYGMDCHNIVAVSLHLNIDYSRMSDELMSIQSKSVPFSYPPARGSSDEVTAYSLFLRNNPTFTNYSYRGAKQAEVDGWEWNKDLDIPYTVSVIESLPFNTLGAIRVVYFPSVPCVEHTDWDDATDSEHTLGLSLIPSTGGVGCEVWNGSEYVTIDGNAMLLNDSIMHRVPTPNGMRITMRLFGKIDYNQLNLDQPTQVLYR